MSEQTDGVPTGSISLNAQMLDDLQQSGIAERDARELARMDAFGAAADQWLVGLQLCARLVNKEQVNADWGQVPEPWSALGPALCADGADPHAVLLSVVAPYGEDVRIALLAALSAIAQRQADAAAAAHRIQPQRQTPGAKRQQVLEEAHYLRPVDAELTRLMQRVLHENTGAVDLRRKVAGEQLIEWLVINGRLIKTPGGRRYYLHRERRQLYALDSEAFATFLYLLTGVNPASTAFRYLLADCVAAANDGEQLEVLRVAHWDTGQEVLRISRFDGTVYRLDGMSIATEANGDGPVVFEDSPVWMPYSPDLAARDTGALEWALTLPHWESNATELSLLYRVWWLATFFPELNPTKPILVLKGDKGSGKTMALRVMLRLLFGPLADVSGVPDKPDAFAAMASNSHISALDNMDAVSHELRDKMAALATGKQDQVRELYTTNEVRTISYRTYLAVTSRTPDTLQRDDLVDRVLLLPVERLSAEQRIRESLFLQQVVSKRNQFWAELLHVLNRVVAEIRANGLPDRGGLRMEDWAAFGSVVADAEECTDTWERAVKLALTQQSDFLMEDNIVAQGIEAWIESPQFQESWFPARSLYGFCREALYGTGQPESTWPRSTKGFGRLLNQCREELKTRLEKDRSIWMYWHQVRGGAYWKYKFSHKKLEWQDLLDI